jgi:hypothetical protein
VADDLGLPVVRVDDQRHADLVRLGNAGQNFDYKGSLVLALLELELGEPVCVMDADNAIHRDPSAGLEDMLHAAGRSVCLVPDPGERPIMCTRGLIARCRRKAPRWRFTAPTRPGWWTNTGRRGPG